MLESAEGNRDFQVPRFSERKAALSALRLPGLLLLTISEHILVKVRIFLLGNTLHFCLVG